MKKYFCVLPRVRSYQIVYADDLLKAREAVINVYGNSPWSVYDEKGFEQLKAASPTVSKFFMMDTEIR